MTTQCFRSLCSLLPLFLSIACASQVSLPQLNTADEAAQSATAKETREGAPQAFAVAEALRLDAHRLAQEGLKDDAAVKAEEAILAYQVAFTILRGAKAQLRLEDAQGDVDQLEQELAQLDLAQAKIAREADTFELQARIHLDTEVVKDIDRISPERAKARRKAAVFLASEAEVLCLAASLIKGVALEESDTGKKAARLQVELEHGSIKENLYPRAAKLRAACLKELTLARRPVALAEPASAAADRLLKKLSEAGYLPFRDDRGVVVQLQASKKTEAFDYLGKVAKAHGDFPMLVLVHGKRGQSAASLKKQADDAKKALGEAGAKQLQVTVIGSQQPIVDRRVAGAATKNARLEVIFIHPGR